MKHVTKTMGWLARATETCAFCSMGFRSDYEFVTLNCWKGGYEWNI